MLTMKVTKVCYISSPRLGETYFVVIHREESWCRREIPLGRYHEVRYSSLKKQCSRPEVQQKEKYFCIKNNRREYEYRQEGTN